MFTYDPTTPRGQVRLLIGDTNDTDAAAQVFADADVDAFLALTPTLGPLGAAALALRAIAANEVQVLKVISNLDLSTDGSKVADSLRQLADTYKAEAEQAANPEGFAIAEMVLDGFTLRERLIKESLRQGV